MKTTLCLHTFPPFGLIYTVLFFVLKLFKSTGASAQRCLTPVHSLKGLDSQEVHELLPAGHPGEDSPGGAKALALVFSAWAFGRSSTLLLELVSCKDRAYLALRLLFFLYMATLLVSGLGWGGDCFVQKCGKCSAHPSTICFWSFRRVEPSVEFLEPWLVFTAL